MAVIVLVAAAIFVFAAGSQDLVSSMENENTGVLKVNGSAQIYADPDHASIILGVETYDESAQVAARENAALVDQVITALKDLGLEEDQVTTGAYRVYGERQYPEQPRDREQEFTLVYRVNNELHIELYDLEITGSVIDTAIEAGANQVQSVNFEIRDPETLKLQALEKAISQARSKAAVMARSADVQLAGIKTIAEDQVYYSPFISTVTREMEADLAYAETPMMPGEISVEARVLLEYFIN